MVGGTPSHSHFSVVATMSGPPHHYGEGSNAPYHHIHQNDHRDPIDHQLRSTVGMNRCDGIVMDRMDHVRSSACPSSFSYDPFDSRDSSGVCDPFTSPCPSHSYDPYAS